MKDLNFTAGNGNAKIIVERATATTISASVFDKDCDTAVKVARDLTGIIPQLGVYNAAGELTLNKVGTISGAINERFEFALTADDLLIYPTIYRFNILLDADLFLTGQFEVKENANYTISYPSV